MLSFKNFYKNANKICHQEDYSPIILGTYYRRGVSYVTIKVKASLCLEAALTIPFFLAAIIAMLFIIQSMQMKVRFTKALYNQQMKLSGYAYYINKLDISDTIERMMEAEYVKSKVIDEIGRNYLNNSYIVNGYKGVHANLFMDQEDGDIVISLKYKMAVPYNLFFLPEIKYEVSMTCHSWVGENKADEEDIVYVTASGSVYHLYKDCSYIKSIIDSCLLSSINSKRNSDGSKYYPCTLCCDEKSSEDVYVFFTKYGTRYHSTSQCSNIKNNVFSISKEKAEQKYNLCSRCEKR